MAAAGAGVGAVPSPAARRGAAAPPSHPPFSRSTTSLAARAPHSASEPKPTCRVRASAAAGESKPQSVAIASRCASEGRARSRHGVDAGGEGLKHALCAAPLYNPSGARSPGRRALRSDIWERMSAAFPAAPAAAAASSSSESAWTAGSGRGGDPQPASAPDPDPDAGALREENARLLQRVAQLEAQLRASSAQTAAADAGASDGGALVVPHSENADGGGRHGAASPPASAAAPTVDVANARTSPTSTRDTYSSFRHGVNQSAMRRAVALALSSAGLTAPHPNSGCVLLQCRPRHHPYPHPRIVSVNGEAAKVVDPEAQAETEGEGEVEVHVVGEGALYGAGTESAEVQAVRAAGEAARGAVAYVALEPGECHGDDAGVRALIQGGVARVVVGLRNPLPHQWGRATAALVQAGVAVDVLGEGALVGPEFEDLIRECRSANMHLLFRAAYHMPFSVLKYAMTLDGKIAASTGHAAWVTSPQARQRVFDVRAQSDAIIVGGNTVRRDNPRLTTRRDGGHVPTRIVMSRTLRLPEDAALWDVSTAPTIVMTQRGAREDFQARLAARGCEVVEFDFLTPVAVMDYCYQRGFLQVLWECGGMLSAPAVTAGVIHKVMAFVAPKIIGGTTAPSPVGELGFVEMTQALQVRDPAFEQVGPDMLVSGLLQPLPDARAAYDAAAAAAITAPASPLSLPTVVRPPMAAADRLAPRDAQTSTTLPTNGMATSTSASSSTVPLPPSAAAAACPPVRFYKTWDAHGVLSNFSAHAIRMPYISCQLADTDAAAPDTSPSRSDGGGGSSGDSATRSQASAMLEGEVSGLLEWRSVEHYYQSQKFACTPDELAQATVRAIRDAQTPEEAARLGRRLERLRPDLVRPDWSQVKVDVMYDALRAKFTSHAQLRELLLATSPAPLVEASPNDLFWGCGRSGTGANRLGLLLQQLRSELTEELRLEDAVEDVRLAAQGLGVEGG